MGTCKVDLKKLARQLLNDLPHYEESIKEYAILLHLYSAYNAGREYEFDHGWWQAQERRAKEDPEGYYKYISRYEDVQ